MLVFLARRYEDVLQCNEAVGYKASKPVQYVKDVIVSIFLVHGCHDFVNACGDGGMVALAPI